MRSSAAKLMVPTSLHALSYVGSYLQSSSLSGIPQLLNSGLQALQVSLLRVHLLPCRCLKSQLPAVALLQWCCDQALCPLQTVVAGLEHHNGCLVPVVRVGRYLITLKQLS